MSDFAAWERVSAKSGFIEMFKKNVIGHRFIYLIITIRYEAERSRCVFKENMEAYDVPMNLVLFEISCLV